MRSRDIVGKRVRALEQRRFTAPNRPSGIELQAVIFEDGSELRFHVIEHDDDYGVAGVYVPPRKPRKP